MASIANAIGVLKFKTDLRLFARVIDLNLASVCKKLVVDTQNEIVEGTPVDTGRARSSWAFSIDEPSDYQPPPLTEEQVKKRDEAKAKGEPSPVFFEKPAPPDVSAIDGTQKLFIVSNLVYIEPLENGHSQQAPAGMVRVAIATMEASMESRVQAALAGNQSDNAGTPAPGPTL